MMMIIFSFLLLAGCIQLGLWYRADASVFIL